MPRESVSGRRIESAASVHEQDIIDWIDVQHGAWDNEQLDDCSHEEPSPQRRNPPL